MTTESYGDMAECYDYTEHNTELWRLSGVLRLHRVTATERSVMTTQSYGD